MSLYPALFNVCVSYSYYVSVVDATTGIRLVNGEDETSGLVELLHNCEWGSVCDDYWTNHDADVACRQLGFLPYGKFNAISTSGKIISMKLRGMYSHTKETRRWLAKPRQKVIHSNIPTS